MESKLLTNKIGLLPSKLQVAFAASCASRILKIILFQRKDIVVAADCVELLWKYVFDDKIDRDSVIVSYDRIDKSIPSVDEEPSDGSSMLSFVAIKCGLDSIFDHSGESAAATALTVVDAVDLMMDCLEIPRVESEIEWQQEALKFLASNTDKPITQEFLKPLRHSVADWHDYIIS